MNDFGKSHLEKYGWKQGEGLGKDKKGIKRSITVTKKNDTNGIGATNTNFDFPWWDHIYNKVSSNVIVDKSEDNQIKVASKEDDVLGEGVNRIGIISVENPTNKVDPDTIITARVLNDSQKNIKKALYSFFVKGQYTNMDANDKYLTKLTDEELFEKCGRRTARRGARFDQSGKIKRTSDSLSEDPSNASSEVDNIDITAKKQKKEKKEKKNKKEKKSKELSLKSTSDSDFTNAKDESKIDSSENDSDLIIKESSKKSKKEKKEKKDKKKKDRKIAKE